MTNTIVAWAYEQAHISNDSTWSRELSWVPQPDYPPQIGAQNDRHG